MCEGDNDKLDIPELDPEAVFDWDKWRALSEDIRESEKKIREETDAVLAYRERILSLPVLERWKYAVQAVINKALLDNEMEFLSRYALEEEFTLACEMLRIPLYHGAGDLRDVPPDISPREEYRFFRNLLNPPYQSIRDSGDL